MNFKNNRTAAVIASAGLLVAMGGVGGAVAANTVGSKDIKNNSIRSVDVKNHNLRGLDVKNGSLGMRDFNQFTKNRINRPGAEGPQGEPGPQGPKGEDGVSGYEISNNEVRWSVGGTTVTVAQCADGKVALGGGYEIDGTANGSAADTEIIDNGPVYEDGKGVAWRVAGEPSGEVNVKAWVICATAS